jgi:two-component system, NarL family, response regulator DegU
MKKIRLLLVESNRLLREGMTQMIGKEPDLDVVAASEDFEGVVSAAQKLKPHVVLLDLSLRDHDSLRAIEMVKKNVPEAKVVVMGLIAVQEDILELVKKGVSGFVLKEATVGDFVKTIKSVAEGAKVLPPQLTGSLFSQIVENAVRNGKVHPNDVRMSKREREVMDLIEEGLSNKEIAQRLHIATYTVKSYVHTILEKLALHTRLEVAAYAHGEGSSKTKSDPIPQKSD